MSMSNEPAEGTAPEAVDPASDQDMTDPADYGSLSVEDDPSGTVDPGELAGGADEDDADVS